jgi:hypothetical protein
MKMKKISLFALLILATTLALAAPAVDPGPGEGAFGEALDVRVVSVEATVTDRQGRRVEGLTAADFRLLVDGREVPVDFLKQVRDELPGVHRRLVLHRRAAQCGAGPAPALAAAGL